MFGFSICLYFNAIDCCFATDYLCIATLIKKKIKFSSYIRNLEWSSCKVIYEEGLPII
jgi:hypothetical protein